MELDTDTIRRLRDALVERGQGDGSPAAGSSAPAALRRVAPFIETMYLVMMADGRADGAERDAIRGAMRFLTRDLVEDSDLDTLLQESERRAGSQGVENRLQAIGSLLGADRRDRETAFTLAAAVALADRAVDAGESELIASAADWFGVSARRRRQLLEPLRGTG